MFDSNKLNRRDKHILKALLYFYPKKRSAAQIYDYVSGFNQKTGLKNAKALGHILMIFPVKSELTVYRTYTDKRITGSRFIRIYVLEESFVKKYYKEKNGIIKLGKQNSAKLNKNVRSRNKE
jgi:hypothetical protein